MKKSSKNNNIDFYDDVYKKLRKNWGSIDPREKVLKSKKKKYKRSIEKRKHKKEINDELYYYR